MIDQRVSKLNTYFDRQISLCHQRNKDLMADDRMDEATFEKIRANVYDIFRTILSVAAKATKNDPEEVKQASALKAEQIPSNWSIAYEKAKQHDDIVKMKIEQIKLDTIREIKETFIQIWEGEE